MPKKSNLSDENFLSLSDEDKLRAYKAVKASRDSYKHIDKVADRINSNTTWLATHGSLMFQSMAEKAGVSSNPSVIDMANQFSNCAYAQWPKEIPQKISLPLDFKIDEDVEKYRGDADMQFSAPITNLIQYLDRLMFSAKDDSLSKKAYEWKCALEEVSDGILSGYKDKVGIDVKPQKHHPMDSHCEVCKDMSYMALDIAQDMRAAMEMLRGDLRAASYRRICSNLYKMAFPPDNIDELRNSNIQVKVVGEPSF